MKSATIKIFAAILLLASASVASVSAALPQESKISPYMLFSYLKDTDNNKVLQARMTNITMTGEVPLPGLSISFYNGTQLLGSSVTDAKGNATYTIAAGVPVQQAEDGTMPFSAAFDGDSLVDAATGEVSITDVDLVMTLSEADSVRTVTLAATIPGKDGSVPAAGEEIGVYVPRMFSLLPVGTAVLDEQGNAVITFPNDLPGDSTGNLVVTGRFNDHYLFGNVEKRESTHWGVPMVKAPPIYRSLWSTLAPKWMVVSLAIMLLGVWSHYMFVIISLIRIRRKGLREAAQ